MVPISSLVGSHDFNRAILQEIVHRPWPMPDRPWVMTQTWHDLLFAHWRIDPDRLRGKIPDAFTLDLFDGQAWIGIVPFYMTNVATRGVPALPWISEFAEVNVRTYVRVGHRPGVYFFSLDAANPFAVQVARGLLNLPYFSASMTVDRESDRIAYTSRRRGRAERPAELRVEYWPVGAVFEAERDSLEYFLTERYCLYATHHSGKPYRLDIHHPPWPLQQAAATFAANTLADPSGLALPTDEPLLHFARRQDIVAWAPASIEAP